MKGPSLIKIKNDLAKAIKDKDPNIKSPKITKVGLFDLMPEDAQDDLRMDLYEQGPMSSPQSPFFGTKNAYQKEIKRLAIEWFKQQRRK